MVVFSTISKLEYINPSEVFRKGPMFLILVYVHNNSADLFGIFKLFCYMQKLVY